MTNPAEKEAGVSKERQQRLRKALPPSEKNKQKNLQQPSYSWALWPFRGHPRPGCSQAPWGTLFARIWCSLGAESLIWSMVSLFSLSHPSKSPCQSPNIDSFHHTFCQLMQVVLGKKKIYFITPRTLIINIHTTKLVISVCWNKVTSKYVILL